MNQQYKRLGELLESISKETIYQEAQDFMNQDVTNVENDPILKKRILNRAKRKKTRKRG